jgi:phenylalanyl-tRNA synthetase alpha chain
MALTTTQDILLELERIKLEAQKELNSVCDEAAIQRIKGKYLGRQGIITEWLREMGSFPPSERPVIGQVINALKQELTKDINLKWTLLKKEKQQRELREEKLDITLPGRKPLIGHKHPLTQTLEEIVDIFSSLGFQIADGPEVELDYYNFEALNIPKDHPARDMQDTFYISDDIVLRTHTSPVQIRTMEKQSPPLRIIAPGKAYRCDADINHSPMFHQVEGLMVDRDITFADLKGTITTFLRLMFGKDTKLRFRPSFFPFTEPSAEVDIQCVICQGRGCRVCSRRGWLEILGSGMVDPAVYSYVNYNPEEFTGFAFGLGIERIAMLKYGIDDIRLFFENDLRFLTQF